MELDPAQIPDRIKIRAFFLGYREISPAIQKITGEPVPPAQVKKVLSGVTKAQVLVYVREHGLPQELLEDDQENPASDGPHLRKENGKWVFFHLERGGRWKETIFSDDEEMIRHVVDFYFQEER